MTNQFCNPSDDISHPPPRSCSRWPSSSWCGRRSKTTFTIRTSCCSCHSSSSSSFSALYFTVALLTTLPPYPRLVDLSMKYSNFTQLQIIWPSKALPCCRFFIRVYTGINHNTLTSSASPAIAVSCMFYYIGTLDAGGNAYGSDGTSSWIEEDGLDDLGTSLQSRYLNKENYDTVN